MINHRSLSKSFIYAFAGVFYALRGNQNLIIHFIVAILVIFAGLVFRVNRFEMGIIGIMILLVIMAEMINTSIEEMVNLIVNEHREQAKIAIGQAYNYDPRSEDINFVYQKIINNEPINLKFTTGSQ